MAREPFDGADKPGAEVLVDVALLAEHAVAFLNAGHDVFSSIHTLRNIRACILQEIRLKKFCV